MSFVPSDELKDRGGLTFAPMIDFLFLMLAVFASLAVTRVAMKDTELELVKTKSAAPSSLKGAYDYKIIHIAVSEEGKYKWVTEIRDHSMESPKAIAEELSRQYLNGLLPEDKLKTQILLKIDKHAQWEPILKVLLAIREEGFQVRPIYEPEA